MFKMVEPKLRRFITKVATGSNNEEKCQPEVLQSILSDLDGARQKYDEAKCYKNPDSNPSEFESTEQHTATAGNTCNMASSEETQELTICEQATPQRDQEESSDEWVFNGQAQSDDFLEFTTA